MESDVEICIYGHSSIDLASMRSEHAIGRFVDVLVSRLTVAIRILTK